MDPSSVDATQALALKPFQAAAAVVAAARGSKGGGGDAPGKRARLRVRVDGGLEVRRERRRSRTGLGVLGGEKPEQARAGRRGIWTLRPPPGQHRSRTGAHGEGGSPRGRASSHSPARCVRATQAAPRPLLPPGWQQPTTPRFPQPCDYQVPTGASSRAPPGCCFPSGWRIGPSSLAQGVPCSKDPGSIQGC